jgi:ATP-dependent Clp protease ATP-binding subunit ClpA
MAAPDYMSAGAWQVIQAAKALAQRDGAGALLHPHHVFHACVLEVPNLVEETLKGLCPAGISVGSLVDAVRARASGGEADSTVKVPLTPAAKAIIERARQVASANPRDAGGQVSPRHLWESTCVESAALEDWLIACAWPKDVIERLPEASAPPGPLTATDAVSSDARDVLNRFCSRNLTDLARAGRLTEAHGMSDVRQQMVNVLLKKNKRSVVLTGPAGVGKTKLAEDLSVGIVRGEVPALARCSVYEFDLVQFARGTQYMGAIEERLAQMTAVLKAHPDDIILFIDELHMVVGMPMSGGGAMNLANALKPLLDCGLRIIGATTSEEYRRYIESDKALERRFTDVQISEPDRDNMLAILRSVAPAFEAYHDVQYDEDAVAAIYDLASHYAPNLSFPAKGVDLMDEVGAQIRAGRDGADTASGPHRVLPEHVRDTLRRVRGIDPQSTTIDLAALLKARVTGQDEAAERLADMMAVSRFRAESLRRGGPRLAVLFVGPPGVGKSHMARALSDILFPGRETLLTLDMTEFGGSGQSAEHIRFRLIGAPPPYVGWENGGILTQHVLQYPHAVVLVDELDKASDEARSVFLRILNDGWVQDGRGRSVSFGGVHFIFTANAGEALQRTLPRPMGFHAQSRRSPPASFASDEEVRAALARGGFAPEFLSRLSQIVVFGHLSEMDLSAIVVSGLRELSDHALTAGSVLLEYDEDTLSRWVVERTPEPRDCRRVQAALERLVETPIAYWRLGRREREPVILYVTTDGDRVVVTAESDRAAVDDRLMSRVAEVYTRRFARQRDERTAQAILGSDG